MRIAKVQELDDSLVSKSKANRYLKHLEEKCIVVQPR